MDRTRLDWWWLSFSDFKRSADLQALGVVIVQANDPWDAVVKSHELGLYPGGEVLAYRVPAKTPLATDNCNRLLSSGDARELAAAMSTNISG